MQKNLVQLPEGGHVVLNELGKRVYKTFMIVGSRFKCDKGCPFCTAHITDWPKGPNCWERMPELLQSCEDAGIFFEYLTMSGNGEPAMNPPEELRFLRGVFDRFAHLFEYRRFQTGGRIFTLPEVFEQFSDFVFEITRGAVDNAADMKMLRYRRDYTRTEAFRGLDRQVVFNHCLLHGSFGDLLDDIDRYRSEYAGQLYALNLKILNVNTLDESQFDNPGSQWILRNGLQKAELQRVLDVVDSRFERVEDYNPFFDRYEWRTEDGLPITLYARKAKYGLPNVVFYKGELVDYQLRPLDLTAPAGLAAEEEGC
ncbi:hypothetical protein ACFL26_01380 [Patescibacteria group bacterium]